MYTTRPQTTDSYSDSKYTVADILSCMANGEPLTPSYSGAGPSFVSSAPTGTTPILTPTTLANLEQSFIELQSVPVTTAAQDLSRQSGFVPPVINPISTAPEMVQDYGDSFSESDDEEWEPPTNNKRTKLSAGGYATSTSSRRPTGPRKQRNEKLTPEEDARRRVRRERNKVAAAKCRQRRVDLTNKLMNESDNLEEEKASLENEIQTLQQQKEQLEFLLQAHTPMCSAKHKIRDIVVKNEPGLSVSAIVVKPDPDRLHNSIQHTLSNSRPNSLPIASPAINTTTNVTMATGVPITTPSSGVGFSFLGLDSMVDGHTGLTPITGPSCASQVQRNSSDSSPSDAALASPTTLMAL